MRLLVATAIATMGATAGTVLSQGESLTDSCRSSLESFESAAEKINKFMNDETVRLQSIAAEVSEQELERRRCEAWNYLDAEASQLLRRLEANKGRLVACMNQGWYDERYVRWNQTAANFRRWVAECQSSAD